MRTHLWILFFGVALLSGCMKVGPNFHPPPVAFQDDWLESEDPLLNSSEEDLSEWWENFNDPVLDGLIALAIDQNLDLRGAAFRIRQARAELGFAIGEWFPQKQEIIGDATRFHTSQNKLGGGGGNLDFWDLNLGFLVAWELDFWGRFRRGIEAADELLLASIANYNDVLVILLGDVASTYVSLRTLEARIDILKKNIAIQARTLEIVSARWEAGMVTELDVQQARTLLASTEARLPLLQAEYRTAENALAVLLGMTPERIEPYLFGSGKIPVAPKEVAVGIPAELLCRRPDIRRALHETAAQSARIGIAITDLLPRISLNGFIGLQSALDAFLPNSETTGVFFSGDSLTYFFGPSVAWPIFNYGRLTSRVRAEYARFYERVTNYQNTVLKGYQEVEDGLIAFVKAHEEVKSLNESVKAANRATALARTQYVEGIADYTRVLNSEQALLDEEERLASANGQIALSLIATYRALGGGWYN